MIITSFPFWKSFWGFPSRFFNCFWLRKFQNDLFEKNRSIFKAKWFPKWTFKRKTYLYMQGKGTDMLQTKRDTWYIDLCICSLRNTRWEFSKWCPPHPLLFLLLKKPFWFLLVSSRKSREIKCLADGFITERNPPIQTRRPPEKRVNPQ